MSGQEYECALTGISQEGGPLNTEDDDLEDLPVGWTRVTIQRRQYNPEWVLLQQVKEAALQGILIQMPEEMRAEQTPLMRIQVKSQFFAMEQAIPMFTTDIDEVLFIASGEDALEAFNEFRQNLGLNIAPLIGPPEENS